MKSGKLILALAVVLLTAAHSWAQAYNPHAVLTGCAAAMGAARGETPILAQGVLTLTGTHESKTITVKSQGSRFFRQDDVGSEGAQSWIVKDGAGLRRNGTQKEKVAAHATRYFRPEHLPALSCAPDLNKVAVTYEGTEQIGGRISHHLKLVAKPGDSRARNVEAALSEFHVFVDQQTFVVLKTSTFVFSPDGIENRSTWETFYTDYRSVGGMLVPFHYENYLSGQKVRDVVLSDVQMGVALSSSEFE